MACRKFLFLQGVATPFFPALIQAVEAKGHRVHKVNFCGGDSLFSWGIKSWRYTDELENLAGWMQQKHQTHRFTDMVLFGDTRPVHRALIQLFKDQYPNVNIYVFEEGYLRPHWITMEQGGVNGFSELIDKPVSFWQDKTPQNTASAYSEPEVAKTSSSFAVRALYDISYRLANATLKPLYPSYQTHRPFNAFSEYLGWARRFPAIRCYHSGHDKLKIKRLLSKKTPFYLFPLQVDADAQIREHSDFSGVLASIDCVLHSFAKYAPKDSQLVIKNHPLDTGLLGYNRHVRALVKQLNLRKRIVFLESGHLPTLLQETRGTVLVNSTTGTSALFHGSPVVALGKAIFDLPGLTFQDGLDRFWQEGPQQKPDVELFTQFRRKIIALSQINGDFYSREGIQLAVSGSLSKMGVTPVAPATQPSNAFPPSPITPPQTPTHTSLLADTPERLPVSLYNSSSEISEPPYLYKRS